MCVVIDAYSMGQIPRSHPEELNNISLLDRLNRLEQRMSGLQEGVSTSLRLHDEHLCNKPNRQYSDALIHGSPTSDAPRSQPHTSQPAANPRNTCPQEPRMSA